MLSMLVREMERVKGQLSSPQSFTVTYTVTAGSGQGALSSSAIPAVLYQLDTNEAFAWRGCFGQFRTRCF